MLEPNAPRDPIHILLVEENSETIRTIWNLLHEKSRFQFHIEAVTELPDALIRLQKGGIDVVLLDLALISYQAEAEAIRTIREANPQVALLVITELQDEAAGIRALEAGAQDYLLKEELGTRALVRALHYAAERNRIAEQRLESDNTFYHLIQNNPFGVYIVDADFRLRQISLGSQKVFSHVHPLIGRDFAEVLRQIWEEPFASDAIGRFRHTLETGEPFTSPSSVERRHDIDEVEAYDWRIERISLPDGRFGVVCYFYDLTERLRWEQALRESEEQRAALLVQEQAARRRAEQVIASQRLFLGMISHELRTPLSSIKGFTSTLLATDVTFDPVEQQQFLEIIDQEADRLTDLIEQLMDIVRMQVGMFRVEPADVTLSDIVDQARPELQTLTARHDLEIRLPAELPPVRADARRIVQVLVNLVGNASKFAPEGTPITLQAFRQGAWVQVEVRDAGPGIAQADRDRVFDVFIRLEADGKRQPGTGLGLTICQGLIQTHGGRIWIADRPEPGTTVAFTLPIAAGDA